MVAHSRAANLTGLILSFGCVIHCMLMPLCIASLPKWGMGWLASSGLHQVLAVFGILLGLWTLVPGWRIHGRPAVMVSAAIGLAIMNYSAFFGENCCELPTNATEAAANKTCEDCSECDQCEHDEGEPDGVAGSNDHSLVATATFSPNLGRRIWSFLWHHPTALGAALLGFAHLLNGSCTRGCCGKESDADTACDIPNTPRN